jgi:hypothetical protein
VEKRTVEPLSSARGNILTKADSFMAIDRQPFYQLNFFLITKTRESGMLSLTPSYLYGINPPQQQNDSGPAALSTPLFKTTIRFFTACHLLS